MKRLWTRKARGQSFIIIALVLAALILLVGLAVDAGNAYAAQRKVQSVANAAAIAGTKRLALARDNPGTYSDVDIRAEVDNVAVANSVSPADVIAEYLDSAHQVIGPVGSYGDNAPPENARYVRVRVGNSVNTYFVRVAGFSQVDVNAATQAYNIPRGAPGCTEGIYPIAVYEQDFEAGETYWIWDGDPTAPQFPGNFGWLRWRQDPNYGSTPYLVEALTPPGNIGDPVKGYFVDESHVLAPGKRMYGNPGLSNSSEVRDRLNYFIRSQEAMILPLWVYASGHGADTTYTNDGFAIFNLEQVCFHRNDCPDMPDDIPNNAKALQVTFLAISESGCTVSEPVDPGDGGGDQNYATAQGMVYLCNPEPVLLPPDEGSHLPVDLVHMVDSSSSMTYPLVGGNNKSKMQIEKEALVYFNALMRPDLGDRLGAVKFNISNSNVQVLSDLTYDIGYLNGRINSLSGTGLTPWAKGILVATETLYDPEHRNPDNKPVLVIASDGAPTIDLDGEEYRDFQDLDWDEMTPETLRYCYRKNSCNTWPCTEVPQHGCPGPRVDQPGIDVDIDALDAADVVKGVTEPGETWWAKRHYGCTSNNDCPFYGVTAHPDMEIFVIAIKGEAQFSGSVLRYVATGPASEHYFEVYQESDVQDIYRYIANAISGQLPYCYIGGVPTLFPGGVQLQVMAGGAVVGSGTSSPDGSYIIPEIPVDPYLGYVITGTVNWGNAQYGAATSCQNPGQVGLQVPMPQIYEMPIYLVPDTDVQCPEGTIPIPPP